MDWNFGDKLIPAKKIAFEDAFRRLSRGNSAKPWLCREILGLKRGYTVENVLAAMLTGVCGCAELPTKYDQEANQIMFVTAACVLLRRLCK
jgi:hypothetical protein